MTTPERTRIVAAVDNSAATRPVLETAVRIGRLLDSAVEALHVQEDGTRIAREVAAALGVPLRVVPPPVADAVVEALRPADVVGVVVGLRGTRTGPRPAGHAVLELVERVHKPVVLVPPDVRAGTDRPVRRVLVPLDGTTATAEAVHDTVRRLAATGTEVVALHVFGTDTAPRVLDHPARDLSLWGDEFLARNCDEPGVRLFWRVGSPAECVVRVAEEHGADLVVLAWSRRLREGRAAVVREALARSPVPVMLVPVIEAATRRGLPTEAVTGG